MPHAMRINMVKTVETGLFSTPTGVTLEESKKRRLAEGVETSCSPANPQESIFMSVKNTFSSLENPAIPSLKPV